MATRKNFPERRKLRREQAEARQAAHAAKGCDATCKKNRVKQ